MIRRVLAVVLLAVGLVTLLNYLQRDTGPAMISGMVEADEIRLGSRVGGRVAKVKTDEGALVKKGDVLFVLEPFDLRDRRAQAVAQLEAARAEHARLTAGYRSEEVAQAAAARDRLAAVLQLLRAGARQQEITAAEARARAAQAQLKLAQQNQERTQRVFRQGASTQQELDRANEELNATEASDVVRKQELAILREGAREEEILAAEAQLREAEEYWKLRSEGFRSEEIAQAKASFDAAQAALAALDEQLAELEIRAPVDGSVETLELQPGDLVAPNAPVLSMMNTGKLWIRAYVPENRLDIAVGHKLSLSIDAFPNEKFEGIVSYVSRQAEFTPGNVQTIEDRSQQVFRIKIDVADPRLRPGMMGDVVLGKR